jgi:PKD domain
MVKNEMQKLISFGPKDIRRPAVVYPSRWLWKVAVLAMSVLSMGVAARAQNWSSPANVSNNTDFSATPQAATDAAGNIYVVWEDDTASNSDILLGKSTDGGATFPLQVNVSPGSVFAFSPRIAIDAKGVIYVVWVDAPTNREQIFVNQSNDGGKTFSGPMALSDASVDGGNPAVAVDSFGNVDLAWEGDSGTLGIFFSHSTDGGVSYSAPVNLATNTNGSFVPRMALGNDGSVNVVWEDDDMFGRQSVSFAHSGNKGGAFAAAQTLSTGPGVAFEGQLSVDPSGNINVAWLDLSTGNGDTYFSRSTNQGASFSAPVNLSGTSGSTDNPRVSNDANGNIYIVWQDTTGSSARDIFFSASSNGGATFSAPQNLSGGLGDATFPQVAVDANNAVSVAWQLSAAGKNNIFAARSSDGMSFGAAQNLLNDSGRSTQVELVTDGNGDTDAVWVDTTPGVAQVFASQFANPKPKDQPPVARVAANQTVHATGPNGASVKLDGSASSDPDGDSLTYAWTDENGNPIGTATAITDVIVPLGAHTFTLTVTDPGGLSNSASTLVMVTDQPPVARAGADQAVHASGPNGASVKLDGSASSDPDGDPLTYAWTDENGNPVGGATAVTYVTVQLGTHTFTLTVKDPAGLSSSSSTHVTVTVRDTTAPTLQLSLSPTNLWPANHKLVEVTASISASDAVDANPAIKLVSITSNDPNTTADDIQSVDGGPLAFGSDVRTFLLRADRDPKNSPRVYTVTYCVKDASGNTSSASAQVLVGPQGTTIFGPLVGGKQLRKDKNLDWRRRRFDRD